MLNLLEDAPSLTISSVGLNLLVMDGELPFVVLQLGQPDPDVVINGGIASVDAAAELAKPSHFAPKTIWAAWRPIRVPGTVGGAAAHECAGAMATDRSYVREVKIYRAAARKIEILTGDQISFEYRHTSFAPDDMMLSVKLRLPSKPFAEIIQGIRICNEKRRGSQPLGQKSAGCIFKNPPGASAGRMIDELGLKSLTLGDARVSDRHANFFINAGRASAADMLGLISDVRERVRKVYGVTLKRGGRLDRVKPIQRNASSAASRVRATALTCACKISSKRPAFFATANKGTRWRFVARNSAARPALTIARCLFGRWSGRRRPGRYRVFGTLLALLSADVAGEAGSD